MASCNSPIPCNSLLFRSVKETDANNNYCPSDRARTVRSFDLNQRTGGTR